LPDEEVENIMEQRPVAGEFKRGDREYFNDCSAIVKALAHPSRLIIVDELSRGERCVHDLTELVGHDISTVSKHLNLLKKNGLVEDDKRGKQVYYRLKIPYILNLFHCIEPVISANRNISQNK
jgi:DNA-binding transcriptional ArsR family regulator